MFCTKCGNQLEASAKFCNKCGAPTNQIQEEALPAQPVRQEPIIRQTAPQGAVPPQPVQQEPIIRQPAPQVAVPPQPVQQEPIFQQPAPQVAVPPQYSQMMQAPYPQTPIQPAPAPTKKSKKGIVIAGICAAVLVIGGGVAGYFLYQNNIKKQSEHVIAYFDDGDYDKSLELYEKYNGKQKAFDQKVEEELIKKAELIKEEYLSENLERIPAKEQLLLLEDYDIDGLTAAADKTAKFIDMISLSRRYYDEGKELFDQGDYTTAILKFNSVLKDDPKYYDLAQKEIVKAQLEEKKQEEERLNNVRSQAVYDAEYYASYYDYTSAIAVIEQGLKELPGDQALTDLLAAYILQHEMTMKVPSISSVRYDNTYTEQDRDIMTVALELPFLEGDNPAYASINDVFEQVRLEAIAYAEDMVNDIREYTMDEYFIANSIDLGYSVKYNQNGVLCIMLEGYEYTGGAHGYPIRQVGSFDLATGAQLGLGDLIATDIYTFASEVTAEFSRMYYEGETYYWEDAQQIVEDAAYSFDMNYYITEKEIVIFFFPYELASYADGFVEIVIPYEGNEWMFTFLQ